MESLEPLLLRHLIDHFNDVINTTVDFSSSSKRILRYVGERISISMIESIKGECNTAFKNKLYMYQLEKLILSLAPELTVCNNCYNIFLFSQLKLLKCSGAQMNIGPHGEIIRMHDSLQNINFPDFANTIHSKYKYPWRSIYWKLWAYTVIFYCSRCNQYFRGIDANLCRLHKEKPITLKGENECRYPCCNLFSKRFQTDSLETSDVCITQPHSTVISNGFDSQVLQ